MGIFDRPQQQKQIINITIFYLFTAVVLLIILLLIKSSQLSTLTSTTSIIKFGPLDLVQIQKIPLSQGGYQATIKMLSGLILYFGLWSAIGGLTIAIKLSNSKSTT